MKTIFLFSLIFCLTALSDPSSGQTTVYQPTFVKQAIYSDVTPPLREMKLIQIRKEKNGLDKEVPNKIGMKEFNNRVTQPFLLQEDPVWQKQEGTYLPANSAPIQNFEGIGNLSGVYPPDTQGDVSPDKYIQVVNMNFAVYSKTGTTLLGPAAISTIFAGIPPPWNGTNNGDPVVLYDQAANRWIITEFSLPSGNYAELVAISQTSDPTGAWYRYVFQFGNKMPDYPKFGIWPDGYYLSVNQFVNGSAWGGVGACALDRTKMLAGDPTAQMVYFDLGASSDPGSMLPADWDGITPPIANEPNYFTYFNDWSSATEDYLKIWQFHVDWTTTANSTFSEAYSLVTSSFDSQLCTATRGRCVPQPGTSIKLESMSDRLMYRLQYRNFSSYRSMVTNHTVDVDGTGRAGIRWYELRNSGSAWTIYQQGTYSPDATHRWMGSVAMNTNGDIALGYSVSNSTNVYPTIRYTGRRANDGLGLMTVAEQTIIDGTGNQTGSACRWGDYSCMSVDPTDDQTFWFTTEYIQTSGTANWKTRIASFKFSNNPSVTTLDATAVTSTTATLNGIINPNGLSSMYHFEWGTTVSYGNSTTTASAGSGTTNVAVSANLSGLSSGTTYHFRLVGVNSDGTTNGNDMTFTPSAAVVLIVLPPNQNVTDPGGTTNFTVTSNVSWTAISDATSWCTVTPSGTGNGTIVATYTQNTSVNQRIAHITVSATGITTQTVTVTQAGAMPVLLVAPVNQNVTAPAGATSFTVTSNTNWTVTSDMSWCVPTPSGTGNGTINAAYIENTSVNPRIATLTVTVSGLPSIAVTVTQAGAAPLLNIVPLNQDVNAAAGAVNFSVTSNTDWTVTCNVTWCNVTIYGSGNGLLTAIYEENLSVTPRVATITVTVNGLSPLQVTVTQTGAALILTVQPPNQDVSAEAGTTNFTVISNTDWTASSNADWCVPTPAGSGSGTITAYFILNQTNQQRIATILVTVNGLTPIAVTVTQDASTVNIEEPSAEGIRIYPNPTKGIFNIIPAEGEKISMNITVRDMNGKVILEKTCKDKKEYQLDLSTSPDGSYNIIIKTINGLLVRKLVIIK